MPTIKRLEKKRERARGVRSVENTTTTHTTNVSESIICDAILGVKSAYKMGYIVLQATATTLYHHFRGISQTSGNIRC